MAKKLGRSEYPSGLTPQDFKAYGPPATKDCEFSEAKMADFGCFMQEEVDSNKYYHAVMVTDPQGKWWVYVEYGRVGATNPQFQFTQCDGEVDARKAFEDQCNEKNTKRGQFQTVGNMQMLRPKAGKDLYLVRALNSRSVGLPDGRNISCDTTVKTPATAKSTGPKKFRCDAESTKLIADLLGGAVTFARTSISGGTIPSQGAIDGGRDLLEEAKKRLVVVGDDINAQVADYDLKHITYALYSKIPKIKPLRAPEKDWILSKDNIFAWSQDIDAFETALHAGGAAIETSGEDPMHGIPADMSWIDPKSDLGKWLLEWWPRATRNRHGNVGAMRIRNLWKVERHGDMDILRKQQDDTMKSMPASWNEERPLHQEKKRFDLTADERRLYWATNTALTFHGTRTVNVPGIIRENLRLPKTLVGVVISGAMFGGGLYWADDWKKSAGYTSLDHSYYASGGGAVKGRKAFMFAADVIMGHPHVAPGPRGYTSAPSGHHSVLGKANVSQVANNEWIIYERGRNALRYLAEFET